MFEQIFKNIDDVLRQETGCGTELDYTEQTSWMLFLKYLDDSKLPDLIELKYHGVDDAVSVLGSVAKIRETFIGFQKHLYARQAAM